MDREHYSKLINKELSHLPFYVKEFYLSKNLSQTTQYQYLTEIRRFFTWLRSEGISNAKDNAEVSLDTLKYLRREDIMLYLDYLKNEKNIQGNYNSPTTINRSINALRSLYQYLTVISDKKDGEPYFYRNVMAKISSFPASQTLNYRAHELENKMYLGQEKHDFLNFLSNQYEQKVNNHIAGNYKKNKERDIAIIALMLGTGARVSEIANSDLKDLSLKSGTLNVLRKGGQKDTVPIAKWVFPYIEPYLKIRKERYNATKEDKALFLTIYRKETKRITTMAIERFVTKYSTAFGKPLTPHKLRHTLASELYQETKDEVLVSQQLGQRGTSATALYTHVNQSKQKDALNNIK